MSVTPIRIEARYIRLMDAATEKGLASRESWRKAHYIRLCVRLYKRAYRHMKEKV